ncbi:MAG: vitamin K epoxide reductase family protein [Chloroflexota bacterium]
MIKRRSLTILLCLLFLAGFAGPAIAAQQPSPVVRAVLFWMDGCPHCHDVLDHVLPPLQARYGEQLEIHLVEVATTEEVEQLYTIAAAVGIPRQHVGVPFLLIGDAALVGSQQIPAELPGLIEQYLGSGGVDYPDISELAPLLPESGERGTPAEANVAEPVPAVPAAEIETASAEPASDGFLLAIVVLIGSALALLYTVLRLFGARRGWLVTAHPDWLQKAIPVLALAGLGIAAYLAYVETQAVPAVCGPVGDCNTVQSSEYAYLFGIPMGVLGLAGYLSVLGTWAWWRWQDDARAPLLLAAMTVVGVLFSLYLTYLEPFVIGAVCAWCLTSAVIMALLLLASVDPAARQLAPQPARRRKRGYR